MRRIFFGLVAAALSLSSLNSIASTPEGERLALYKGTTIIVLSEQATDSLWRTLYDLTLTPEQKAQDLRAIMVIDLLSIGDGLSYCEAAEKHLADTSADKRRVKRRCELLTRAPGVGDDILGELGRNLAEKEFDFQGDREILRLELSLYITTILIFQSF